MINLKGQRFDRLRVLEFTGRNIQHNSLWKCKCNCGNIIIVCDSALKGGKTRSCGCLRREMASKSIKKLVEATRNGNHPMLGKHHSKETKKKLSEVNKGKKLSKETKKKIGESEKGEKHWNWNPSLTDEDRMDRRHIPGYSEWRETVYERDHYTCQICGQVRGDINAHHLESYRSNKELRTKLSNGATVCENCHKDFHHQYGYGDNTKEQFEEFKEKNDKSKYRNRS